MPDELETGAYARQAAWHGHGTVVDGAMTTKEAFKESGLDWPGGVEKRPLFTVGHPVDVNAEAASLIVDGATDHPILPAPLWVPDKAAVVRVMDDAILGVVGPNYQVMQNVDMFGFLDALTQGEGKTAKWESAGSLKGGRHVWALLSLADTEIMVGKNDQLLPYLLITNAHDGSASCRVIPTTIRVVCWNTLSAAIAGQFSELTVSIRHTGDLASKIADAKLMLAKAGEMFGAFEVVANAMNDALIDKATFESLVKTLFPDAEDDATDATKTRVEANRLQLTAAVVEEVKLLAAPDMTFWTALQGVTRFVDHNQKVQLRGRDGSEARFENSFLGRGAAFKELGAKTLIDSMPE